MDEKQQEKTGAESLLETWMKMSTEFWGSMAQMWPDASKISGTSNTSKKGEKSRSQKSWESTLKTWQAWSSVMSKPGAMEDPFQEIGTRPEIMLKMVQAGLDGFFHLQRDWLERAGRIGKSTEAYKFENLDQGAFKELSELYEKEFKQFLNIPQLGLTRSYQERMGQVVDKFNLFQAIVGEFLYLLYLPIEKSSKVVQEKMTELADEGKLPEDSMDYYRMWIRILEGHYMTLFQSPEYTQTLGRILDAMGEFAVARRQILQDAMQSLPVPTHKDMDELYKDIYLLKKRIRELEKKNKG